MRKYAAATALVIALNITMLTPAVSAGCAPLNGRSEALLSAARKGISVPLALESYCFCQCGRDVVRRYAVAPAGTLLALEKERQACLSKCVNAFEAAYARVPSQTFCCGRQR
jgi:hypothetical protein